MTLQEFLRLISDEEQRCDLEIDEEDKDYSYLSFWLSDFRQNMSIANNYKNCLVTGFRIEHEGKLVIEVKKVNNYGNN